jgi:hypothetical protein
LLLFGAESFVFQFAIQNRKDYDIENYNFARFETWSLILREERRMQVFENRALRILFRLKRDEVTGECRKLNNEEHREIYFLQIMCG